MTGAKIKTIILANMTKKMTAQNKEIADLKNLNYHLMASTSYKLGRRITRVFVRFKNT